jgi:hypothetical protein
MQPPDDHPIGGTEASGINLDDLRSRTEQYAREEPMQAVGVAFVAGLILTLLPVGAIIAGILRLILALLRPALVILGAVKVYEEVNRRKA